MQIVGKVINKHSKLFGLPIENFYYVSVCMRLGACFVDAKGERCPDPLWTMIDVSDKNKALALLPGKTNKFRTFKNGVSFNFTKGNQSGEAAGALPLGGLGA